MRLIIPLHSKAMALKGCFISVAGEDDWSDERRSIVQDKGGITEYWYDEQGLYIGI